MKNYFAFFLLASIILAFSACTELSTDVPMSPESPIVTMTTTFNDNPIMYCGLAVGQKSAYVLLEGRQYFNNSVLDDFNYLPDTLIVEVVSEDENGFLIQESLTENSAPLPATFYLTPDSSFQYYLKIDNNHLHFFDLDDDYGIKSTLFWQWKDSLDLATFSTEINIEGWKTTLSYCECAQMGYDPNYELFGTTYENLNISIRNTAMQLDGPGTTFMYSNVHGMVRSSQYSWWGQAGYGWDLLGVE